MKNDTWLGGTTFLTGLVLLLGLIIRQLGLLELSGMMPLFGRIVWIWFLGSIFLMLTGTMLLHPRKTDGDTQRK